MKIFPKQTAQNPEKLHVFPWGQKTGQATNWIFSVVFLAVDNLSNSF
jgi:hypothetical protein